MPVIYYIWSYQMCGIIGAVGIKSVSKDLIKGLYNLEYRGYDSAGITIQTEDGAKTRKVVGGIKELDTLLKDRPIEGTCGIGHTRWATHGAPSIKNCHPIYNEQVTVVHNGIIENYASLKDELSQYGFVFNSDTDTEVIAHLIAYYLSKGLDARNAVVAATNRMTGFYAFIALIADTPGTIIGYKHGAPLLIGLGINTFYLGSDAIALASFAKKIVYLEDGELAVITSTDYKLYRDENEVVNRDVKTISEGSASHKGQYQHFMLKEIMEQPQMLVKILRHYTSNNGHQIIFPKANIDYNSITSIKMIACGSSYYSAEVASYWMEELMPIPVSVDIASEFCYRSQKIRHDCLYIFISQSGETADTLAALRKVTAGNGHTLSIVNVEESSIARLSQHHILSYAGAEVSVASTKACTAQLMVLALLSLQMAINIDSISEETAISKIMQLQQAGDAVHEVLVNESNLDNIAKAIYAADKALYIGRSETYPIALEGALKLREITYITAMGVAAGELKHGTIALVDEHTPTIVIAPYNNLFSKTAGSARGVHARGGSIQLLSSKAGIQELSDITDNAFIMPQVESFISPIVYSVAVQLIAYKTGILKGLNVDKPRNLAKSVTVE